MKYPQGADRSILSTTPHTVKHLATPPLTPLLVAFERGLSFAPATRAAFFGLIEAEYNLHPGEIWDVARAGFGGEVVA